MELFVKFRWDREAVAGFVPALMSAWTDTRLGPGVSKHASYVSADPFESGRSLATVKLGGFDRSAGRFDQWLRTGKATHLSVGHAEAIPGQHAIMVSIGGSGRSGSEPGSLRWWLRDEARHQSGFAADVTTVLAQVAASLDVIHGGCGGLHGYGFGAYGRMANPAAFEGVDASVLVDHDWQVILTPEVLAKLDRQALDAAAVVGAVQEFESPGGGVGAVVRIADDVESVSVEQWKVWQEALSPALAHHERLARPLRHGPPPHIEESDWILMSGEEIDELLGIRSSPSDG